MPTRSGPGVALLLLLAPATLQAAPLPESFDKEDRAEDLVKRLGGEVRRDYEANGKPVVNIHLAGDRITDVVLRNLGACRSLKYLGLDCTSVTDAGIKELKHFKNLQQLLLVCPLVTREGILELGETKSLKVLILFNCGPSNDELQELREALPNLEIHRFEK